MTPTTWNGNKTKATLGSKIVVRYYRHTEDDRPLHDIFVSGTLYGSGAPYAEGITLLTRRIIVACCLLAIGLSMTVYDVAPLKEMGLPFSWCGWFAVITSVLLMGHSWYFWRSFRRLFDKFIPDGLKDLQDAVRVYKLRPSLDGIGYYEPSGPSGFWIADQGGEIVGFVGLKHSSNNPKVGEMSRLVVSPAHRRRGIGEMLIDTAVTHARGHGLEVVELTTSELNKVALAVYRKNGWNEVRRVYYGSRWLPVLGKRIG